MSKSKGDKKESSKQESSKKEGPISEYLDALQPDAPTPDPPDSPTWAAVKKGAKWGALAGFIVSHLIIAANSIDTPVGSIYAGNLLGLFAVCIGFGTALGAGIGWLSTKDIGDDEDRPRRDFPQEPFA